ncbi:MAG: hypothetical protein J6D03_07460 [Clostridia bacterium]|nr:hypothetical protein [Clostridia bacterium]
MNFENFKDTAINEIEVKKDLDNTDKKSGIYAIYIKDFDYKLMKYEPRILPVYIGQSKNMYTRMQSHQKRINEVFSYTINEFNKNLKTKKESQYMYHKIRKCINDTRITQDNIKFKVLEYCEESKLLERENYYIDLYKTESLGFNQLSSIPKMVIFNVNKASEREVINLLELISKDIEQVLEDKYKNNGFSSFNASMLCYNSRIILGKIESKERNPKNKDKYSEEVIVKFNETLELYGKIYQETDMIYEIGIPPFIEWDLKLEKLKIKK